MCTLYNNYKVILNNEHRQIPKSTVVQFNNLSIYRFYAHFQNKYSVVKFARRCSRRKQTYTFPYRHKHRNVNKI